MSNTGLRKIHKALLLLCSILFSAIVVNIAFNYGGNLDGKLFPAAERMLLTGIPEVVGGSVEFYGVTTRLRPECNFLRIDWYLGERTGRSVPIPIDIGRPEIRPNGEFNFGPWTVYVPTTDIFLSYTYANVIHDCKTFGINNVVPTVTPFWN